MFSSRSPGVALIKTLLCGIGVVKSLAQGVKNELLTLRNVELESLYLKGAQNLVLERRIRLFAGPAKGAVRLGAGAWVARLKDAARPSLSGISAESSVKSDSARSLANHCAEHVKSQPFVSLMRAPRLRVCCRRAHALFQSTAGMAMPQGIRSQFCFRVAAPACAEDRNFLTVAGAGRYNLFGLNEKAFTQSFGRY